MKVVLTLEGVSIPYKAQEVNVWIHALQEDMFGNTRRRSVRMPYKEGVQERLLRGFIDDVPCMLDVQVAVWVNGIGSIPGFAHLNARVENGVPV